MTQICWSKTTLRRDTSYQTTQTNEVCAGLDTNKVLVPRNDWILDTCSLGFMAEDNCGERGLKDQSR